MRTLLLVLMALAVSCLQGCFPLVAAGVGAGALSIADRRTTGAQVDDTAIELKVSSRLKEQFGTAQYDVDITSFNRRILLTGTAANEEIKTKIGEIAAGTPNVAGVTNEIVVGFNNGPRGDALVTSNVKTRFLTNNEGRFSPNHIKVVTENGTVYLLGLVTQAEADAAAEVARTSKGVLRVVKVFEYLDKAPEAGTAAANQ